MSIERDATPEHPPTYLVTGATSGIGEAIATRLAAAGAYVIVGARSHRSGEHAVERIRRQVPDSDLEVVAGDLSELAQVRRLAGQVTARHDRLDGLILNAGVARPNRELTPDGFEVDFAINHLSQFLLTHLLADLLHAAAPSRVVTVTSSAQAHVKTVDLDALVTGENFHHMHTYSATKLLNVLFVTGLSRRPAADHVTANAADPGFVRTRLGRDATGLFGAFLKVVRPFQATPTKAAATPVHLATSPEVHGVTGAYFADLRQVDPGPLAQDQPTAERLWTLSEQLTSSFSRPLKGSLS